MEREETLERFRKALREAQNPLFMFDNDIDGLVSYLLLKKFCKKGYPFIVKSTPKVTEGFLPKIERYDVDVIFILDKPLIEQEFLDHAKVPVYWIDHHPVTEERKGAHYFNPRLFDAKDTRPTSYWCYQITQQDDWLAACGIVGDWYVPDFLSKFRKEYPGLAGRYRKPGELFFKSKLGLLVKMMSFLLKGKDRDIAVHVKTLEKIQGPYDLLEGRTKEGRFLRDYFNKVNKHYEEMVGDAKKKASRSRFLVYVYGDAEHSFTGFLANELIFLYPRKIIVVARSKDGMVIMSLRSSKTNLLKVIEKIIPEFHGYGGGHDHACAARIPAEDFSRFLERFKEEVGKE